MTLHFFIQVMQFTVCLLLSSYEKKLLPQTDKSAFTWGS